MVTTVPGLPLLPSDAATSYAEWFACLAEPTRVRLLHAVATAAGAITVGELAERLGISQSTCSHHVRTLAETGFVHVHRRGAATLVSVHPSGRSALPHAADAVLGAVAPRPHDPADLPQDVRVRALRASDWPAVRRIYAEGIATGEATFETEVASRAALEARWLSGHRWVAEVGSPDGTDGTDGAGGEVAGWAAASAVSKRGCYRGVAETSVYVGEAFRGRGVGRSLLHQQVTAADGADLWTLQTSIFPENRASLSLHHAAGYRTVGIRERIAQQHGRWRDTVLLERRRTSGPTKASGPTTTSDTTTALPSPSGTE